MELSEADEISMLQSLEGELLPQKRTRLKGLRDNTKKVQMSNARKPKISRDCRIQCKLVSDFHKSGYQVAHKTAAPTVRIMFIRCMRCLKAKGYLDKRGSRRRRKRRDISFEKPASSTTATTSVLTTTTKPRPDQHLVFGGWISSLLDVAEETSNRKWIFDKQDEIFRSRRVLSSLRRKRQSGGTPQLVKVTRHPIVVDDKDEDYENNYDDEPGKEDSVADLEKKTQNTITYFLVGSFAFFAVLCTFVFPVTSFGRMCYQNFRQNAGICHDLCCCRDPKYRLVKDMSVKCGIPIAPYKEYRRLMKEFSETDAFEELKSEKG